MDKEITNELFNNEKLINAEKYKTAQKKSKFIKDIKGQLGKDIKANPGKAKIRKISFGEKLMNKIKDLFTKF